MLRSIVSKATVLVMVIGLLLMIPAMSAKAYANCQKKIQKAEKSLEKAIQKHGLHSDEAARKRDQLENARARCKDK